MSYNVTNLTASNNILDYTVAVNQLTGGWFFAIALSLVFVIVFISMKASERREAFLSASFVTLFLGAILWASDVISETYIVFLFVVFLFALVSMFVE